MSATAAAAQRQRPLLRGTTGVGRACAASGDVANAGGGSIGSERTAPANGFTARADLSTGTFGGGSVAGVRLGAAGDFADSTTVALAGGGAAAPAGGFTAGADAAFSGDCGCRDVPALGAGAAGPFAAAAFGGVATRTGSIGVATRAEGGGGDGAGAATGAGRTLRLT
jgi:hypothetical protein